MINHTQLKVQSEKFHAFEWLRAQALAGNGHALVLMREISRLNGIEPEPMTPRGRNWATEIQSVEVRPRWSLRGLWWDLVAAWVILGSSLSEIFSNRKEKP